MAFWNKKQPEPELLPHEKYPELLYWEEGDEVQELYYYDGNKKLSVGKFVGLLNEKIYIQFGDIAEEDYKNSVQEYSLWEALGNRDVLNTEAKKRYAKAKKELLLIEMRKDHYNDFLKALREVNEKMISDWKSGQYVLTKNTDKVE